VDLQKEKDEENKIYLSVINAFRLLSANGHVSNKKEIGYLNELDTYITYESLRVHLPEIFGYFNDSMALRFYNALSVGKKMKRIYLPQFMAIMYPLIYGNWIEKNYFAFRLLDGDNDGIISAIDLSDLIKNVLDKCPSSGYGKNQTKNCKCILYQEIMSLYNMSLSEDILVQNKKMRKTIDFPIFLAKSGILVSCLVLQFQNLLLY